MVPFSKMRRQALCLAVLMLIALPPLAGCAGGPSSNNASASQGQPGPETQRSIATAIALKAAQGTSGSIQPSSPSGPRTAAEISASAPTSGLLDSVHLASGKGCDACHATTPVDENPDPVTTTRCLSCHGGSYDAVAAKTASLGARNPHKAHTGREDCDRCHHVHQPFEFSCNACHTFPIPAKYQVAASVQHSSEPAQPSDDKGAIRKETED